MHSLFSPPLFSGAAFSRMPSRVVPAACVPVSVPVSVAVLALRESNRVLGIPEATKSFPEGSPHIGAHSDSSDATVVFEVDSRVVNVTLPSIEGGGGGGGGGFSQSVYQRAQRGSLQPTPRIAEHFMHAQRCGGGGAVGCVWVDTTGVATFVVWFARSLHR